MLFITLVLGCHRCCAEPESRTRNSRGVSPAEVVPEPLQRQGLVLYNVICIAPALVPPKTTAGSGLGFGFFFLQRLLI